MSMRRRLLLWLLSSVLLGGLAAAAVVFVQARAQANEIFDYQLRQLALTLRDRSYDPTQLAEALQGEEALEFAIQVWARDGRRIYVSHPQLRVPSPVQVGFDEVSTANGRWRSFVTQQRGLTIQVAQPVAVRDELALKAAWHTLAPFLVTLPLMGLLIWHLVGHEVRFLETTARAVAARTPESLAPIDATSVPEEVQPLVEALNGLLGRLGAALSQQRQFVADAAHELRTPLTALRLQLQLAERARDEPDRERAHAMLREGIARAVHLVEQLLTLAREDPEAPARPAENVDLSAMARSVIRDHEPAAAAKGLALDGRIDEGVSAAGSAVALRALLQNLVDNAIRYTPAGAVTVRVRRQGAAAILEVEDTGPGIPAAERERVFDRFYRGESAAEGGTGLGLAIVRRIAQRHGGTVELLDAPGGGLLARATLPAAPDPA
ncbi:MAG TPA: ATP-binding protein [Usitatibacter sp.]|nr:ATP-binding protein [Usitatibacter sp.]